MYNTTLRYMTSVEDLCQESSELFICDDCPDKLDRTEGVDDICKDCVGDSRNVDMFIYLKLS